MSFTVTEGDRERAREAMEAYHMETNRPAVRDLLAMKPIDASRALLDAFNAWEPFIASALAEQRERMAGKLCAYCAEGDTPRDYGEPFTCHHKHDKQGPRWHWPSYSLCAAAAIRRGEN